MTADAASAPLWHVTVSLCGAPLPDDALASTLGRLCQRDPSNMSARYASDCVELRYWDEGASALGVAEAGSRLWEEASRDLPLPAWSVVGLEILDRATYRRWRGRVAPLDPPGAVVPLA
jgi:hypothetical protein